MECKRIAKVHSQTLRTVLSAIPFIWSDEALNDVSLEIFTRFAKLQWFSVYVFFRVESASRSLCKLVIVSCDLTLHPLSGKILCNDRTHDYCAIFPSSLGTLWSAVIRSSNLSAFDMWLFVRFLHGVLVVLIRLQISQFNFCGKCVRTFCCLFELRPDR